MFSQACAIPSVHRGRGDGFAACITGHMTGGSTSGGGGSASRVGGGLGRPPLDSTGYCQRAGSMHPTGMHSCLVITACKRSLQRLCFYTCLSIHRAGTPPPGQVPPTRAGPPPEQCLLGDTASKRAVRILLECILVFVMYFLPVIPATKAVLIN